MKAIRYIALGGALCFAVSCTKKEALQVKGEPLPQEGTNQKAFFDNIVTGPSFEDWKVISLINSDWKEYKILKGQNYNVGTNFSQFFNDSLYINFTFDSTAIYKTVDPNKQIDWNKLIGFSDCNGHHQQNSVRMVWRWIPDLGIQIGEYYYVNRVRSYNQIGLMQVGDTASAKIFTRNGKYNIHYNLATQVTKTRACNSNAQLRYLLTPYFGGTEPSPQDMSVFIEHIYP
jgi:hypothetical protein